MRDMMTGGHRHFFSAVVNAAVSAAVLASTPVQGQNAPNIQIGRDLDPVSLTRDEVFACVAAISLEENTSDDVNAYTTPIVEMGEYPDAVKCVAHVGVMEDFEDPGVFQNPSVVLQVAKMKTLPNGQVFEDNFALDVQACGENTLLHEGRVAESRLSVQGYFPNGEIYDGVVYADVFASYDGSQPLGAETGIYGLVSGDIRLVLGSFSAAFPAFDFKNDEIDALSDNFDVMAQAMTQALDLDALMNQARQNIPAERWNLCLAGA